MKDIPLNIIQEKNKRYSEGAWVLLIQITLLDDSSTVVRFARNVADVEYGGETYYASNFSFGAIKESTKGALPTINLSVSNINRPFAAYLESPWEVSGSEVILTPVNTKFLSEDYSDFEYTFTIGTIVETAKTLSIQLTGYSPLTRKFPPDRYNTLHCRFHYRRALCGYSGKTITSISFPSGTPVSVGVTSHGFETGDDIRIESSGITGLDDNYDITYVDANNFTLDGTDGDDFTGPYTSGGLAGYHDCTRVLDACRDRENSARFGAFLGLRSGVGIYAR